MDANHAEGQTATCGGTQGGILTQRLLQSPLIRRIHVGKFRSRKQSHDDVILVGDDFVHLKKLSVDGKLRHVATKDDFHCQIRRSEVFGGSPQVLLLVLDSKEIMFVGVGLVTELSSSSFRQDVGVLRPRDRLKAEAQDSVKVQFQEEIDDAACRRTTMPFPRYRLVIQIIYTIPLPVALSILSELDKFIATHKDATSGIFAIAAAESRLFLCMARKVGTPEIHARHRLVQVPTGFVVHALDFLHSPDVDQGTVNLVLVGTRDRKTCGLIFTWNRDMDLSKAVFGTHSQSLEQDHGMTVLLAALKFPGSFLLVCERFVSIYQYGHDGTFQRTFCQDLGNSAVIECCPSSITADSAQKQPFRICYARPDGTALKTSDEIYLAQQDGTISRLSIGTSQKKVTVAAEVVVVRLGVRIQTAFAMTFLHSGNPAIVFACDEDDGGVYEVYPRNETSLSCTLENWAPANGLTSATDDSHDHEAPRSLYAAGGSGAHGAIRKLEFGLEVRLSLTVQEIDCTGCTRMWSIGKNASDEDVVVCSYPWKTTILTKRGANLLEFDIAKVPPLAASNMWKPVQSFVVKDDVRSTDAFILITGDGVRVFHFTHESGSEQWTPLQVAFWSFEAVTASAVEVSSLGDTNIVLCTRNNTAAQLGVIRMMRLKYTDEGYSLNDVGPMMEIPYEASCAILLPLETASSHVRDAQTSLIAAIGCPSGDLYFLQVNKTNGHAEEGVESVKLRTRTTIGSMPGIESLEVVCRKDTALLLCGLRDGELCPISLALTPLLQIAHLPRTRFGVAPVLIMPHERDYAVFVHCGNHICHLDFSSHHFTHPKITELFFTPAEGEYVPIDNIQVFCLILQSARMMSSGWLDSSEHFLQVLCVSGGQLSEGLVDSIARPLLASKTAHGYPHGILYSDRLHAFLVHSTQKHVDEQSKNGIESTSLSLLGPLAPNDASPETVTTMAASTSASTMLPAEDKFVCEPGESITAVIEWWVFQNIHWVVIGTAVMRAIGAPTGSLTLLKVSGQAPSRKLVLVKSTSEPHPVTALCQYGQESQGSPAEHSATVLYGCGMDLRVRRYSRESKKLEKKASYPLTSPALYITSSKTGLIYITTAHHALLVFTLSSEHLSLVMSEDKSRSSLTHLHLNNCVLIASSPSTIIAMPKAEPPAQPHTTSMISLDSLPAYASAHLARTVTVLTKARIRPSWKQNNVAGILERDIYGLATDGSLFTFTMLSEPALRLLKTIEKLCICEAIICPRMTPSLKRQLKNKEVDRQVDGDVLARLLALDCAGELLGKWIGSEGLAGLRMQIEEMIGKTMDDDVVRGLLEFLRRILETPF